MKLIRHSTTSVKNDVQSIVITQKNKDSNNSLNLYGSLYSTNERDHATNLISFGSFTLIQLKNIERLVQSGKKVLRSKKIIIEVR